MKKYTEMMEHIRPTDCQKNKMLEKAFSSSDARPKRSFKFKYCAAALAAIMIFSTTTVFADEIKQAFYNLLGKNEITSEDVLNEVFSDDDGHVKITVKELLSDGINSYAIVEYSALDDKGKWWIDKPLVIGSKDDLSLHINYPQLMPGDFISNSFGVEELPEYHTENSRLFQLTCFADRESPNNSVRLVYNLYDKFKSEAVLNVSQSVQYKDVKIDSHLAPQKNFEPISYKISSLGFSIYANYTGKIKKEKILTGEYYSTVDGTIDTLESLYLVMKDGKIHDMLCGKDELSPQSYMSQGVGDLDNQLDDQPDISLYSAAFPKPVDIDTIAGIELDGVYYPIDRSE